MNWKDQFQDLITGNKLFHAYLLWGQGEAKLELALSLANYLETNLWLCDNQGLIDGKVFSEGGIGEARQLRRWLWQKPVRSRRRTALVAVAEAGMTAEAQNALLKIAEEPPPAGLILLVIDSPDRLWPTLVSRFQKIYIPTMFYGDAAKHDAIEGFLQAAPPRRRELLKEIINNGQEEKFVKSLMWELDKDPVKNFMMLKELCRRWQLINQFNVNKKLQLEAVSQWIRI